MKPSIEWCIKQKKGIRIVTPNNNLCFVYIKKAKSSLNMLSSAIEKEEYEWIATTSYYAKYFSVYALLIKCGIKCEIHDCTIACLKNLFVENGLVGKPIYKDLVESKDMRVMIQYYVFSASDKKRLLELAKGSADFVLNMEKYVESLDEEKISMVRDELKRLITRAGNKS